MTVAVLPQLSTWFHGFWLFLSFLFMLILNYFPKEISTVMVILQLEKYWVCVFERERERERERRERKEKSDREPTGVTTGKKKIGSVS